MDKGADDAIVQKVKNAIRAAFGSNSGVTVVFIDEKVDDPVQQRVVKACNAIRELTPTTSASTRHAALQELLHALIASAKRDPPEDHESRRRLWYYEHCLRNADALSKADNAADVRFHYRNICTAGECSCSKLCNIIETQVNLLGTSVINAL